MSTLRTAVIRLAYEKQELRQHLLPLVHQAALWAPGFWPMPISFGVPRRRSIPGVVVPTLEDFHRIVQKLEKMRKNVQDARARLSDVGPEIAKQKEAIEAASKSLGAKGLQEAHEADLAKLKEEYEESKARGTDLGRLGRAYNRAVADKQTEFKAKLREMQRKDSVIGETRSALKKNLVRLELEKEHLHDILARTKSDADFEIKVLNENFGTNYDIKDWEEGRAPRLK